MRARLVALFVILSALSFTGAPTIAAGAVWAAVFRLAGVGQ